MLKKVNNITTIVIYSFFGVFAGKGIFLFWDYNKRPELYAMTSAPWYTELILYGIVVGIVVTIAVLVKIFVRWKMKQLSMRTTSRL